MPWWSLLRITEQRTTFPFLPLTISPLANSHFFGFIYKYDANYNTLIWYRFSRANFKTKLNNSNNKLLLLKTALIFLFNWWFKSKCPWLFLSYFHLSSAQVLHFALFLSIFNKGHPCSGLLWSDANFHSTKVSLVHATIMGKLIDCDFRCYDWLSWIWKKY